MAVLTRRLVGYGFPELNISDLVYTYHTYHLEKLIFGDILLIFCVIYLCNILYLL